MPFRGGEALDEVMGAHRDAVVTDEGTQVSMASVSRRDGPRDGEADGSDGVQGGARARKRHTRVRKQLASMAGDHASLRARVAVLEASATHGDARDGAAEEDEAAEPTRGRPAKQTARKNADWKRRRKRKREANSDTPTTAAEPIAVAEPAVSVTDVAELVANATARAVAELQRATPDAVQRG